jgi:hypothetical protein
MNPNARTNVDSKENSEWKCSQFVLPLHIVHEMCRVEPPSPGVNLLGVWENE